MSLCSVNSFMNHTKEITKKIKLNHDKKKIRADADENQKSASTRHFFRVEWNALWNGRMTVKKVLEFWIIKALILTFDITTFKDQLECLCSLIKSFRKA